MKERVHAPTYSVLSSTIMTTADSGSRALVWLLRIIGVSSLFALIFVGAPHSWMRDIHQLAGLGVMPDTPVVWYLARSTSAFYAIVGGLFLLVARDLERHRPVVVYLGWSTTFLGAVLLIVDVGEGMPPSWTLWEGPFVIAFGIVMLYLVRSVPNRPTSAKG